MIQLVIKDIYNARQHLRNEALDCRTPIQALVEQMQADDFDWKVQHDDHRHVTQLFFAYKQFLEMYPSYPEVLLVDCTYKTNRFHMPRCSIMGITGINTLFFVALALFRTEQEADNTWVLQQLAASVPGFRKPHIVITDCDLTLMDTLALVLPNTKHMLCKWHICTNVEAKCLVYFRSLPATAAETADELWQSFLSNWVLLVGSLTVSEYKCQLSTLKKQHRLRAYAIRYVDAVWVRHYKERFVYAWTF